MARTQTDVLIIGGGWTGVSAAAELQTMGVDFHLLEADPTRLGGRAYSFTYDPPGAKTTGHRWEHGAQYIGQAQTAIWNLVQQHCPGDLMDGYAMRKAYPQQIMLVDQQRFCYDRNACLFNIGGLPPGLGFFDLLATILMIDVIQTVERAIDVLEPWNSPSALLALDQVTMDQWLASSWLPPGARSLVSVAVNAVLSVEPDQVSPFYFFWYSACNDGFLQECNDEQGGPQQYFLRCGVDALVDKVAAPFLSRIVFDSPVQSIDTSGTDVVVTTTAGDVWVARQVILALSPHTAAKITYTPALPSAYTTLMAEPMGRTIKSMVYYKSPWWRDSHKLQYTGYSGASEFPVTWVMDYSPDDGSDVWCLMTFTIGQFVTDLGPSPTPAQITDLVTHELCFLFDDVRALEDSDEFVSLVPYTWNADTPYSGGGPNTVFGPNVLTGANPPAGVLNQAIGGRVWLAAAETTRNLDATSTSRYYDPATDTYSDLRHSLGYMDGAIHSGRFVANQVAKALGLPYNPGIDQTFPSTPPSVTLPAPTGTFDRATVARILTTLKDLFYAQSALQFVKPISPMELVEKVGEMLGAAMVLHLVNPDLGHMQAFVQAGYAYNNSTATDADTQTIQAQVKLLEGLVDVLSAATTSDPAPTARLSALDELVAALKKKLGL